MEEFRARLDAARITLSSYAVGHSERLVCPACDGGKSGDKDMVVSIDALGARWDCHRCGEKGHAFFDGTGERRSGRPEPAPKPPPVFKRPPPVTDPEKPEEMYKLFGARQIGQRTVDAFGCYVLRGEWFGEKVGRLDAVVFPYAFRGEVVNRKYRGLKQKQFKQDGNAQPTLFNIDRVEDEIVWVEGEMDVLAMFECGIKHAVTPRGTLKGRETPPEFETHKHTIASAKRMIIAGDMDEVGQQKRQQLISLLGPERCWVVTWPDGCKDACDVLRNPDYGTEAVLACLAAARPYRLNGGGGHGPQPGPEPSPKPGPEPEPDEGLVFVRGVGRPISEIPPRQWAYGTLLLAGSASVIGGTDGVGKGTLAVAIIASMITGKSLLGDRIWRTGRVAILTYEDDATEWERRFAALSMLHEIDLNQIMDGIDFVTMPGGKVLIANQTREGLVFNHADTIARRMKGGGYALLLVDPFNSATNVADGNANVAIAQVAGKLTWIAQEANVAVLVLHHLRKGATGNLDDLMGAVALRANFRVTWILAQMTEAEALQMHPPDEYWRYVRVAATTANYSPPLSESVWYSRRSMPLTNPTHDYPAGDNVSAIERWKPPALFDGLGYAELQRVFQALAEIPHAQDNRAKKIPWAGEPIEREGKDRAQAGKILGLWSKSGLLTEGEPVRSSNRTTDLRTYKLNQTLAAEVMAGLRAGAPPSSVGDMESD